MKSCISLFRDEFDRIFEDGIVPDGTSICWLMSQLNLKDIADSIEKEYYVQGSKNYFHYPVELMIKLFVVVMYRRIPFRYVQSKLTGEDIAHLLPRNAPYSLPSGTTLHHFIKYRLGEDGVEELMFRIGKKIAQHLHDEECAIIDSTPLNASIHSTCCLFNPHYKIKMDKAHILSLGDYPLFMIHSKGTQNDMVNGKYLLEIGQLMHLEPKYALLDKGYDSIEMHTRVFEKLHAKPIIQLRNNAVKAERATEENVNKWVNKFWRQGGNEARTFDEKLLFLAGTTKRSIVGKYLRNESFEHWGEVEERYKNRTACERKHSQIKKIVKFDVIGYRSETRGLYVSLNFIAFQIMTLAQLQNRFQNPTSLAKYL